MYTRCNEMAKKIMLLKRMTKIVNSCVVNPSVISSRSTVVPLNRRRTSTAGEMSNYF